MVKVFLAFGSGDLLVDRITANGFFALGTLAFDFDVTGQLHIDHFD